MLYKNEKKEGLDGGRLSSAEGGQRTPSPQISSDAANAYSYESEIYAGVIIMWRNQYCHLYTCILYCILFCMIKLVQVVL